MTICLNRHFPLQGRPRAVQVNVVSSDGRDWLNVMSTRSFGLASSAWTGRSRAPRKQGLRRQAQKLLAAAAENSVSGQAPQVVFSFHRAVSDDVADELRGMGCQVQGIELKLTTDRLRDGLLPVPGLFALSFRRTRCEHAAMWWGPERGRIARLFAASAFERSAARRAIGRAYRALHGLESEVYTLLLRALEIVSQRAPRVELPAQTAIFEVIAGKQPLWLLASQEKGCRLVFNQETTSPEWRDLMWLRFADFCEAARTWLARPPGAGAPLGWWQAVDAQACREGGVVGALISSP